MVGKRSQPSFRRTSSMSRTAVDLESKDAAAPLPPEALIGGEFDHLPSPRFVRKTYSGGSYVDDTADFLRSCGLCNRPLSPGRDIYMYRGDTAFCSPECREQQMLQDERKERQKRAAAKAGHPEIAAAAAPKAKNVATS